MNNNTDNITEENITATKEEKEQEYSNNYKSYEDKKDINYIIDNLDDFEDIEYAKKIEVSSKTENVKISLNIKELNRKLLISKINKK